MINAKEYKPAVNEMIDLMNRQRDIALDLLKKVKTADDDKEFLWAIREYFEAADAQAEALEKIARMTAVAFENENFKKLIQQK